MIKDIALNGIEFVDGDRDVQGNIFQEQTYSKNIDLTYDSYKNSHQASNLNNQLFVGSSNMYEKVDLSNF